MNLIDASQYRKMLPYIEWEGDGGNVLGTPRFPPFKAVNLTGLVRAGFCAPWSVKGHTRKSSSDPGYVRSLAYTGIRWRRSGHLICTTLL